MTENSDASVEKLEVGIEKVNYDAVETSSKNLKVSRKRSTRLTSDCKPRFLWFRASQPRVEQRPAQSSIEVGDDVTVQTGRTMLTATTSRSHGHLGSFVCTLHWDVVVRSVADSTLLDGQSRFVQGPVWTWCRRRYENPLRPNFTI